MMMSVPWRPSCERYLRKNGATLTTTKRLGKFRFAYPIKKSRYGHYVLVRFESEPSVVAKIEEGLRITNDVVRHMILRADEAGEETFDMVQFTEVNIEAKDEQRRRRERPASDEQAKKTDEIKSGVAVLEEGVEASTVKKRRSPRFLTKSWRKSWQLLLRKIHNHKYEP